MAGLRPGRLPGPGARPVARILDGPSCSVLELEDGTLVPLISDAVERIDLEAREIRRERRTSSDEDRRLHALPGLVRVVHAAAPRARTRWRSGHELDFVDLRASTPLNGGPGRRHAVRRRGRHGDPRGRGGGRAARALRRGARRRTGRSRCRPGAASSTTRSPASWPREPALTLLCGRYEGFDERVHEHLATDVVSIGPYVLAGGELAAMVVWTR